MRRMRYIWFLLPIAVLLFSACEDESEGGYDDGKVGVSFGVVIEKNFPHKIMTKAVPSNYSDTYFSSMTNLLNFGIFVPGLNREGSGVYNSATNICTTTLRLDPADYKLYSYYPQTSPSSASLTVSQSSDQDDMITFHNVPFCSDKDILLSSGTVASGGELNRNSYNITLTSINHTINMMMDHVLAKVNLNFTIDQTYSKLRKIEITKVSVGSSSVSNSSFDIACLMGSTGIVYNMTAVGNDHPSDMYSVEKTLQLAYSENRLFTSFYVVPQVASNVKLTVEYNVYDTDDRLVRSAVSTTNANINITSSGSPVRGYEYSLNLNVVPTYLYVLSDNDDGSVLLVNE